MVPLPSSTSKYWYLHIVSADSKLARSFRAINAESVVQPSPGLSASGGLPWVGIPQFERILKGFRSAFNSSHACRSIISPSSCHQCSAEPFQGPFRVPVMIYDVSRGSPLRADYPGLCCVTLSAYSGGQGSE